MENEYIFSSETIESIHKSIKRFVEDNYGEELIFFDHIWEIYEKELKRWLNKPPKKYRFKRGKVKHPKFLSISSPSEALDLTTPKIIEIISSSLFQVAGLREHVSLKRIGEIIIQTCGKKLSSDFRLKLVNNFAPIMLEDLEKMKLVPEKEVKIKPEMDSRIEKDEKVIKKPKEEKEYVIFSHDYPLLEYQEGKKLSRKEFSEEKEKIKNEFGEYIIIIDEISKRIVIDGNSKYKITRKQKIFLKLLIKKADFPVKYETIIRAISKMAKEKDYEYNKVDNYIASRCFTSLHKKTKNKLENYIENVEGVGYKFNTEENPKYCLIEPLK